MIDCCDIVKILNSVPYRKIRNVEVIGWITRKLPPNPHYLEDSPLVAGCFLAEVKLFAIKFSMPDPVQAIHNDSNPSHTYFCNGYMSIALSNQRQIGDWFSVKGAISIPRGSDDILNMFRFKKLGTSWLVDSTIVEDVDVDALNKNSRVYKYLLKSDEDGRFYQPSEVLSFTGGKSEEEVQPIADNSTTALDINDTPVIDVTNVSKPEVTNPAVSESAVGTSTAEVVAPLGKSKIVGGVPVLVQKEEIGKVDTHGVRFKLKPMSESFDICEEVLYACANRRTDYLEKVSDKFTLGEGISKPIEYMLNSLKENWFNKANPLGMTGRALVKEYLEAQGGSALKTDYLGTTVGAYLMSLEYDLIDYTLGNKELDATKVALTTGETLFGNAEVVYAGVLSRILKVNTEMMVGLAQRCNDISLSFSQLVNTNPYLLCLVSTSVRFKDIEEIALCLGLSSSNGLKRSKNICILFDYTLNSSGGSTIYSRAGLYKEKLGITVPPKKLQVIKAGESPVLKIKQANIRTFVNPNLREGDWCYPSTGWESDGFNGILPLSKMELDKAIQDFASTGLGIDFKVGRTSWLTNTSLLEKELFVYKKLYQLSKNTDYFTKEEVEAVIAEFEEMKGFKLEQRQRDAIYLVYKGCGVVTGPAGSGKTTVSEAMVYALRKKNDRVKIKYATPTGKSATRLQEVVGGQVKTMHSMFCVWGSDEELFDDEDEDLKSNDEPDVYMFDENAMVTIDLLYQVLKKINKAKVFFLGDIEQLPPIGKGLPFKNMLSFLPYVALNVTKRSAEGSNISNTGSTIINNSDKHNWKELESRDDCFLNECADENISENILELCKWYLGKSATKPANAVDKHFDADDIQVISPVTSAKYNWSTTALNKKLQDLFNPRQLGKYFFFKGVGDSLTEYRLGDRVIHTSNSYAMQRYTTWKNGVLQKSWDLGVINGDVGKIVGVMPASVCKILEPDTPEPENRSKLQPVDDSEWIDDDVSKYFIVVEYFNYALGEPFYILYQSKQNLGGTTEGQVYSSSLFQCVQLAYALTVHKMQGSQSKLCIMALGSLRRGSFLTRNLVYTGETRAEELFHFVGNVGNSRNSALSIARTRRATDNTYTVMDLVVSC